MNKHHRKTRAVRRRQRGQTIIIFALSVTVLLGIGGLAIDVMRLFDLYARAERAAEAGALAGVMYLPCFYSSNTVTVATGSCPLNSQSPDGNTAIGRAMQEVFRNGFGTGSGGSSCVGQDPTQEVAVCTVAGKPTDLRVTITETASVFLLSQVGVGATTISTSGQAEYLPAIQMGSRENYFGDQGDCGVAPNITSCDPTDTSLNHLQNFLAVTNGPQDLKDFGDAYVYCEEGADYAPPEDPAGGSYTIFGITTNHPLYGGVSSTAADRHCGIPSSTSAGNLDQQPTGYSGPKTATTLHPGAHNYAISTDLAGATVWVYNGNYIPSNTGSVVDHWQSGSQNEYPGALASTGGSLIDGCNFNYDGAHCYYDDASLYMNTTYTLYSVPAEFLRTSDKLVSGTPVVFPPYDMMSQDLTLHGCTAGQVFNPQDPTARSSYAAGGPTTGGQGCITLSNITPGNCFHAWCLIDTLPSAGMYRLAVESTGVTNTLLGWGSTDYGLRVCAPGTSAATVPGCVVDAQTTLSAWNNMTVIYRITNGTADFDLAYVPASYAGRTLQIGIYDPGDASGDVFMRLVPPAGSGITVTYPPGIRTGPDDTQQTAIWASHTGDTVLNALWVNTLVTLPPSYAGGWWTLHYDVTNGSARDTVTVAFSIQGSPVHLVVS